MGFQLDHLVISARDLSEGRSDLEQLLSVRFSDRGVHGDMGTHNHLVALDDGAYLEVIAVDPEAAGPQGPRWFDLDHFDARARLTNWVVACDDLEAALALAPSGAGEIRTLSRGDFTWRMAVPEDGKLPFGGAFPALIEWQSSHPAPHLPQADFRLRQLKIAHPEAGLLRDALAPFCADLDMVRVVEGRSVKLTAEIGTRSGEIWLT